MEAIVCKISLEKKQVMKECNTTKLILPMLKCQTNHCFQKTVWKASDKNSTPLHSDVYSMYL